jgi:hypothetical protein
MSSSINFLDFSVKYFFQPIWTDYSNLEYFNKTLHLYLLLWTHGTKLKTNLAGMFLGWSRLKTVWQPHGPHLPFKMPTITSLLLLYFKSKWTQIENQMSYYRSLQVSSFVNHVCIDTFKEGFAFTLTFKKIYQYVTIWF